MAIGGLYKCSMVGASAAGLSFLGEGGGYIIYPIAWTVADTG